MRKNHTADLRTIVTHLFFALMLSMFSAISLAHEYESGEINIDHPWARPSRGATLPVAVYFDIVNSGQSQDRLISATTTRAEHVELHASEVTDAGTTKMRHLKDGITIPADAQLSMETGTYHVMLIGLENALTVGDRFPMILTFENAGRIEVIINVEDRDTRPTEHHLNH